MTIASDDFEHQWDASDLVPQGAPLPMLNMIHRIAKEFFAAGRASFKADVLAKGERSIVSGLRIIVVGDVEAIEP